MPSAASPLGHAKIFFLAPDRSPFALGVDLAHNVGNEVPKRGVMLNVGPAARTIVEPEEPAMGIGSIHQTAVLIWTPPRQNSPPAG